MDRAHSKLEKLLREREETLAKMNARVAEAQRVADIRERKEQTRLKIVIGACVLADLENNPQLAPTFEQSLKRTATPRDAEFLRSKGFKI